VTSGFRRRARRREGCCQVRSAAADLSSGVRLSLARRAPSDLSSGVRSSKFHLTCRLPTSTLSRRYTASWVTLRVPASVAAAASRTSSMLMIPACRRPWWQLPGSAAGRSRRAAAGRKRKRPGAPAGDGTWPRARNPNDDPDLVGHGDLAVEHHRAAARGERPQRRVEHARPVDAVAAESLAQKHRSHGPLWNQTTAVQVWQREPLFMPPFCRPSARGPHFGPNSR
jgi:hypothetical protein